MRLLAAVMTRLAEQYKKDPVKLSADELLYYATLVDGTKTEEVYQTAARCMIKTTERSTILLLLN